jgi:hypothetical protein
MCLALTLAMRVGVGPAVGSAAKSDALTCRRLRKVVGPATSTSASAPHAMSCSTRASGPMPARSHTSAPRGADTMCTVPGGPWPPTWLPASPAGHRSPLGLASFSSCTATSKRGLPFAPGSHTAPAGTTVRFGA